MQPIYILIMLAFVLLSFMVERNIFNPVFIFAGTWTLIMILSSLRLFDLVETSFTAYTWCFIGVLCFCVGCFVRSKFKFVFHKNSMTGFGGTGFDYDINYRFLIVFYLIILLFTIFLAIRSIGLLLIGVSFERIRFNYDNLESGQVISSALAYRFEMYVVQAAEFAGVALFPLVLFAEKRKKKLVLLMEITVFLILHLFVTGARSFMIDIVFGTVVYFLINNSLRARAKEYFDKIPRIWVYIIVAGAVGLVIFATNLRKGEGNLWREIYRYFAISLPLFDVHLSDISEYTHGWTIIYGLVRPPLSLLHSIGLPFPDGLQKAIDLIVANNDFYYVGGGKANSFVTVFYYFMMDFGAIGIPIGCFLYGYFSQAFYSRMQLEPNKKNQAFYLLISIGLFLSFVRLFFTAYRYVYAFFILVLAFKKINKDSYLENLGT